MTGAAARLIVFSGLPGVGKTTLARALAARLGAVHLRIDSIEQAILGAAVFAALPEGRSLEDAGYRVGYAVAADNLRLGRTVVADSVNPIELTRAAWRRAAWASGAESVDVEVVCSDRAEHRRRVETRASDIDGLRLPSWADVEARDYQPWRGERIQVDTAGRSVEETLAALLARIGPA